MEAREDAATAGVQAERTHDIGLAELATAATAGFVATAAMAPILGVAFALGALSPSSFTSLSTMVGLESSFATGAALFVLGGTVTLPLLFVSLGAYLPPLHSVPLRGVTFATVMWTGFTFAFYSGQEGTTLALYLGFALLAHWTYGYVLGRTYDRYADIVEYAV